MTPEQLVSGLRSSVVDENVALYHDLFTNTVPREASDPYWRRALAMFGSLPEELREVFFEVVRQVVVDTTSSVLGVVDGVSHVEGAEEGLELTCGAQRLNGDLQSLFLAEEERRAT